jgi:hypothetical protein
MSEDNPGWSTPTFILVVLGVAFGVAFVTNAVFNMWLDLGLGSAAIGAPVGVATVFLLPRWSVYRRRFARTE